MTMSAAAVSLSGGGGSVMVTNEFDVAWRDLPTPNYLIIRAKRDSDEDDFDGSDAGSDEGIDNDELGALSKENIITTGRRTRGIRIDYTKVEGFNAGDDSDEEEEEEPKKKKKSSSSSKSKAKPSSAGSSKKAPAPPPKPVKKAKKVIESDEDEEAEDSEKNDDDHDDGGKDEEGVEEDDD
ncbi:hypothetical protein K466DRAFT_654385 [Polyporus arcularius HHB13444]|uniref:Histone chaperone domain-containing protein n=1 Tax=Polyporus arcularius HHB13444 TaxID=1314778 RepID=A0A5C3PAE0_9APHY|nr:hypothetical protein K466DRAFT_654385 [Polyporus arcularius HHB13444]